ncbi:MAG: FMN-binding protein [Eubacterium sp.]
MNGEGKVTGISITSESETAGLGANCENADWQKSFAGKVLPSDPAQNMYNKNEETDSQVQALSGATVTSRAITNAVKGILFASTSSEGGAK